MNLRGAGAAAIAAAMIAIGTTSPAIAGVEDMPFGVHMTPSADDEGFAVMDISKGRTTTFTFEHPYSVAGIMAGSFDVALRADGGSVRYLPSATKVHTSSKDGADVVTLTHEDASQGVKVERTFTVGKKSMAVDVTLTNLRNEDRELSVDMNSRITAYGKDRASFRDGAFMIAPQDGGYETTLRYKDPTSSGVAADKDATTAEGKVGRVGADGASFQRGRWERAVPAGGKLHASMTMDIATQGSAVDSDRDGLPDAWERQGFTTASGEQFPLQAWGADPHRPDLYLQLNWAKSEWETLGCDRDQRFGASAEQFGEFAACNAANANVYRPSRSSLLELVDLFDRQGINLHIDAGSLFNNIPNYGESHGGATEDFEPYYFKDADHHSRLAADRDRLLGPRESVFRVGIIGDQLAKDDYTTGMGLVSDSVFYVAKHEGLTGQDQVRNTILHEFGHNLGLTHTGSALSDTRVETTDLLRHYESVMNYLYQFARFDYSDTVAKGNGDDPHCGDYTCYTGAYEVAPDWEHLDLGGKFIGKVNATVGADESVVTHDHMLVRDLEIAAAEHNAGQAGFRLVDASTNSIVTSRNDNSVTAQLRNLGLDLDDFTVDVAYPGGNYSDTIRVPGQLAETPSVAFDIPITGVQHLKGATMPLDVAVRNKDGEEVFAEHYDLSLLDYSAEEAKQVREEVLADPDAPKTLRELAEAKLGAPIGPTETPTDTQSQEPGRGSSTTDIVIAVLAALGGVIALIAGGAWSAGMLPF